MFRKTISCSDLCIRWEINTRDLTDIVSKGKLQAYNDVYELVSKDDGSYSYIEKNRPTSGISCPGGPLPITDENGFYFHFADVEAFEKEERIKPRTKEKPSNKKRMPTQRLIFVYEEAQKMHREIPSLNKAVARTRINMRLKQRGFKPYSRTQFNRIIKDIGLPPAQRGRKPS